MLGIFLLQLVDLYIFSSRTVTSNLNLTLR